MHLKKALQKKALDWRNLLKAVGTAGTTVARAGMDPIVNRARDTLAEAKGLYQDVKPAKATGRAVPGWKPKNPYEVPAGSPEARYDKIQKKWIPPENPAVSGVNEAPEPEGSGVSKEALLKKALQQKMAAATQGSDYNFFLMPFDAGAGAAKGAAVGAGAGLALGSVGAAALTWALMKNPRTRDYIQNMLSGAAVAGLGGAVVGGPAGALAGLNNPRTWGWGRGTEAV